MKQIWILILGLILTINIMKAQDTLYIYKAGAVYSKCAISQIDSVTFQKIYPITDIDGNIYHSVKIGTQTWMVENLKVTHYRNGDAIPNVTSNSSWAGLTNGAYCDYNNNAANSTKYGKLYNFYAVGDARNIAPIGWHVATDAEWTTLEGYVASNLGTSTNVAKALAAKTDWVQSPGTSAVGGNLALNNSTGFTALPGGCRNDDDGVFMLVDVNGVWWSSTEDFSGSAWNKNMYYTNSIVARNSSINNNGLSVRCIKD